MTPGFSVLASTSRNATGSWRPLLQVIVALVGGTCSSGVFAQFSDGPSTKQTLQVTPRISVSEVFTNNAALSNSGKRSEFTSQVSPGVSIRSDAGRVKGAFDYSLNAIHYANGTSASQLQNALNTAFVVEAVDNFAFLDFSGNISQQTISAFGTRSQNDFAANSNSTETSTYSFSPYLRGRLTSTIDYEARVGWLATSANSAAASDLKTNTGLFRLSGQPNGALGWGLDASSEKSRYSLGRTINSDQVTGRLMYSVNPQLNLSLYVGQEADNYTSPVKESRSTSGLGFNWAVGERTKLAAQLNRRSFGNSHKLSFEHRTARTLWRFSDSRDVAKSAVQSGATSVGTLGDLLYNQFAGMEADPVRRAELVQGFLLANGYDANSQVLSNFLASSASLQRRQEISFALTGIRDTVSFSFSRGSNSKLDNFATSVDDFSTANVIRQSGFVMSYSHRLTPDTALNILASRQSTSANTAQLGTTLRTFDVILSGRLGKQMFASIGARRVFFDSVTSPYAETAFTGNLNVQF